MKVNELKNKAMYKFNKGDKVKVVDSGYYYPAYESMECKLNVQNSPPLKDFNNIEFTIIAKGFSPMAFIPSCNPNGFKIEETYVYGIESNTGDQFLFGEKGLN